MSRADEVTIWDSPQPRTPHMPRTPAPAASRATLTPVASNQVTAVLALPAFIVPLLVLTFEVLALLPFSVFAAIVRNLASCVELGCRELA